MNAVISIPDGEALLEGQIPAKKLKSWQAWIAIHEDELMADWTLAVKVNQSLKLILYDREVGKW